MLNAPDLQAFAQTLADKGFPTESLRTDVRGTLQVGPESYSGATLPDDARPHDSHLTTITGANGDLELGPRIARGGHGDVFEAHQRSLSRDVAAKRPRGPDASGGFATVMEARVIGALEHPNIIPVHTLGADEGGTPIIVMKRISGKAWSETLDARASLDEDLHRHIELLVRICDALRFAHDRGVLHCDLKPQNVMVGEFGEAYLLDWGLARAVGPHAPLGMLQHDAPRGPIGTPGFMAPEMVDPDGRLDERTDVYLLGGTLCFILTGKPVHTADTLAERLFSAVSGRLPSFPPQAPDELVDICARALARNPADRFESVGAFQQALREHLEHRAASDLLRDALARLAALEALMLQAPSEQARRDVARVFGETRFGLLAALQVWPEYGAAKAALARCLEAMARYELAQGHLDAAALLIQEMESPPTALVDEIARRRASGEAEVEALRVAARQGDVRYGRRIRGLLLFGAGILALVSLGVMAALHHLGVVALTPRNIVVRHTLLTAVICAGTFLARRHLFATRVNRVITTLLLTGVGALLVVWFLVWQLNIPLHAGFVLVHFVLALVGAAGAATDPRLIPGALSFGVGSAAIAYLPEHVLLLDMISVLVGASLFGFSLRSRDPDFNRDSNGPHLR